MRVLVTGGAGFIGSHLVELLLAQNHEVTVLDNFYSGTISNLPRHERLRVVEGDIRNPSDIKKAIRRIEAVFHLAAVPSVEASIVDPIGTNEVNASGTLKLLEEAKLADVKRFVYASSAAVYGNNPNLPLDETAIPNPLSPYAIDKLIGEYYVDLYHRTSNLTGLTLRFFNVYGPRQNPESPYSGVISIFADRLRKAQPVTVFGDGEQTRDFIFVKDLAEILAASLHGPVTTKCPVINVGVGKPTSINSLLVTLKHLTGNRDAHSYKPERSGDIRHSLANVSKLETYFPGMARTNIETGLRQTVAGLEELSSRTRSDTGDKHAP